MAGPQQLTRDIGTEHDDVAVARRFTGPPDGVLEVAEGERAAVVALEVVARSDG